MSSSDVPVVSVIVPVYNDARRLRLCLDALQAQTLDPSFYEVIVVDNGSTEDLSFLETEYPGTAICREEKTGSYAARNHGIGKARGAILAFTDSDCIPNRDWLKAGYETFGSSDTPTMVGGKVQVVSRKLQGPTLWERLDMASGFPQQEYLEQEHYAVTANLFANRVLLDAIGPFDENVVSGGDQEWGMRAHGHGCKQIYGGSAAVLHPARASFAEHAQKHRRVAFGKFHRRGFERYSLLRFLGQVLWEARPPVKVWSRIWLSDVPNGPADKVLLCLASQVIRWVRACEVFRTRGGGTKRR